MPTEPSSSLKRKQLDQLFLVDSTVSIATGLLLTITPHRLLFLLPSAASVLPYNHNVHEALRLYGCLRIAVGWMLYKIRAVDDGYFRRGVTEALCVCYALQSLVVLRAQLTSGSRASPTSTDSGGGMAAAVINWVVFVVLAAIGSAYGRYRFGRGGKLIKVYELPTSGSRAQR